MSERVIGLIDVFAQVPLSGNPLAVVEDADDLTDQEMQRIAGELNQAETTFFLRSTRADRRLRSFTAAGVEVFGAGHNALGAWLWLGERGALGSLENPRTFQQELGQEVLPIVMERIGGRIHGRMRQSSLGLLPAVTDVAPLAVALGLDVTALLTSPAPRPAHTEATHLLVRARDDATVDQAAPDHDLLRTVLRNAGAEGCYLYAFDERKAQGAYARFFNPTVGLWEDAATGTAAGPLAAYLARENLLRASSLVVVQGVKMGRRSLLHVRLTPEPELSGAGVVVLQGTLRYS